MHNKNIPTKTIQLKYRAHKSCRNPWLTKGLLKSMRTKAKLYKNIFKNPIVAVKKISKTFKKGKSPNKDCEKKLL